MFLLKIDGRLKDLFVYNFFKLLENKKEQVLFPVFSPSLVLFVFPKTALKINLQKKPKHAHKFLKFSFKKVMLL